MGLFAPEKQFSSVAAIDAEWDLLRLHLTHVLLDLDNTLRRRDNDEVPLEVRAWLTHVQQKGIKPCILSNNFHENVFAVARELDIPIVAKAMKPLSSGFKRALALVEGSVEDSVMVGDQLFTDVVGAHLVGMPAYLVAPLVDVDLKHTQLVRKVEGLFLKEPASQSGICLQDDRANAVSSSREGE